MEKQYFFISDLHFNHNKDFIYKKRGFSNINEMNEALINNWNSVVNNNDTVFVLGDFFLGTDTELIEKIIDKLKGEIILIIGNHDTDAKLDIYRKKRINIYPSHYFKYGKYKFYLSHYPSIIAGPNDENRNFFNLFGHTHSEFKFYGEEYFEPNYHLYNVAADACLYPTSIEDIIKNIFQEKERQEKFQESKGIYNGDI